MEGDPQAGIRFRDVYNHTMSETPKFIALVEQYECIWKKSFRNSLELRRQAWDEIAEKLYGYNWDHFTPTDKKAARIELQKKWKNIKDCFLKELKIQQHAKSGHINKKRKYIFFDCLTFLKPEIESNPRNRFLFTNKNYGMDSCSSSVCTESVKEDTNFETYTYETHCQSPPPSPKRDEVKAITHRRTQVIRHKTKKGMTSVQFRTRLLRLMQQQNEINAKSPQQQCAHNDDESFFQSLLPIVRKLDDQQKIQFRMDVLSSLKNIRNINSAASPTATMNVSNLTSSQQQPYYPIGQHQLQIYSLPPDHGELSATNGGHVQQDPNGPQMTHVAMTNGMDSRKNQDVRVFSNVL